jgi:hypothetical protein
MGVILGNARQLLSKNGKIVYPDRMSRVLKGYGKDKNSYFSYGV